MTMNLMMTIGAAGGVRAQLSPYQKIGLSKRRFKLPNYRYKVSLVFNERGVKDYNHTMMGSLHHREAGLSRIEAEVNSDKHLPFVSVSVWPGQNSFYLWHSMCDTNSDPPIFTNKIRLLT